MTEFRFGKKPVLHVHMPENEGFAAAVLEETYRNYTGQSPLVGPQEQIDRDTSRFACQPSVVEGIIDVSGSMKEELNGENKIDISKLLMLNVINRMIAHPDGAGMIFLMRVLGQNSRSAVECQETELVVAPGRIREITHYKLLVDKILSLKAGGPTPLAFSLACADYDIYSNYSNYPGKRSIFLISDGMQTKTCHNDPFVAAERLRGKGTTIHVTTVGLEPNGSDSYEVQARKLEEKGQLAQIASPGKFRDTESLAESTRGAPYVAKEAFGSYKAGQYVFPSPAETYGQLQARTSVDGQVLLPKRQDIVRGR